MPGEVAALVALDEVVVHGWDLARATGQDYDARRPPRSLRCLAFAAELRAAGGRVDDGGLFGPPVPVPADAPRSTG